MRCPNCNFCYSEKDDDHFAPAGTLIFPIGNK